MSTVFGKVAVDPFQSHPVTLYQSTPPGGDTHTHALNISTHSLLLRWVCVCLSEFIHFPFIWEFWRGQRGCYKVAYGVGYMALLLPFQTDWITQCFRVTVMSARSQLDLAIMSALWWDGRFYGYSRRCSWWQCCALVVAHWTTLQTSDFMLMLAGVRSQPKGLCDYLLCLFIYTQYTFLHNNKLAEDRPTSTTATGGSDVTLSERYVLALCSQKNKK